MQIKIKMLGNSSICDDQIFAQLTDMFGDSVPTEVILRTGLENKWILDKCVDKLIKFDSNHSLQMTQSTSQAINDDDVDVLVESEEIQPPMSAKNIEMQSASNQEAEKRPPWPSNMSFSNCLQNNVGFSATNPGFRRNGSPHVKQPRLASNSIEKHPDVPEIIREIEKNHRIMIIMRGAPGSGKTYLAQSLIDKTMNGDYANHIFSADDFFLDTRTKRYIYDRSKLSQAHDYNQFRVSQRAMNGWSPIIVDNTNMKLWEMFPYVREGVKNLYIIKILEPNTPWRIAVGKLAQRNEHGVPVESISRMLQRYEPGSVQDVLRSMQINYKMEPKLRCFPEILCTSSKPNENELPSTSTQIDNSTINNSRHTPKSQRPRKHGHDRKQISNNDSDFGQTFDAVLEKIGNNHKQWPAFEEEQGSFWNSESIAKPRLDQNLPKSQRQSGHSGIPNLYNLLQDSNKKDEMKDEERTEIMELKKHKKNCENENCRFKEIRQIYPTIPVALLWDLFEKCNGDANWTMDILLNESETKELQKLNNQDEIDRDDFTCYCDIPAELKPDLKQVTGAIPNEWLKDSRAQALPQRNPRRAKNAANESEIRKQIEEQFVISDERYSKHTRKIRDLRRGGVLSTVASNDVSDRGDPPSDETVNEDDEMIEMNLGIELVCQLDQVFGSSTFQSDTLKDLKTKVFMPKTLGQQLYAIWIESLYNQIEEQKRQSIKDDEEFAKELRIKQTGNSTSIFEYTSKPNIQNIAEMEYTWKAYSANPNEWKQTTPEDLATKLTKAKLFEIFPNVERQQLIDVFSSYGNQFSKTVDFFKESLKSDIDDKMQSSGLELENQAHVEAQAIRPSLATSSKPISHRMQQNRTLDKLDIEDAKRAALKEFEDSRNMAMHHAHLKAECYLKAREAFQRKQTGVAYYYSNVASLHSSKIEHFNHKAANAIVEVHSYTQQNRDMLDLHYLHAGEAIECLDVYLDQHIKELKDTVRGFKYVFIITGRGLHSTGGFSTIKHRVKCRLKERSLTWAEVNPGLLKVKLQYISLFVHDINKQN